MSGSTEMDKLKEFNALEDMLTKAGIEYDREDKEPVMGIWDLHQLMSKDTCGDRYVWDVICHKGSYGYEQGLLEMWGKNMNDPEGYLTAKECFEKIKEIVENELESK